MTMEYVRRMYERFKNDIHDMEPQTAAFSAFLSGVVATLISMCYFVVGQNGREKYTDIVSDYLALDGVYKGVDVKAFYILICSFVILFYVIYRGLKKRDFRLQLCTRKSSGRGETLKNGIFSYIYIYLALTGIEALIQFSGRVDISEYSNWVMLLTVVTWVGITVFMRRSSDKIGRYISYLQALIPCNILGIINTRYIYQENEVRSVALEQLKSVIVVVWLVMEVACLGIIIRKYCKKQKATLQVTTVVAMLMILAWNCDYDLLINTDTFHMGETAIVYNQIVNLEQRWGIDFSSIMQGMGLMLSGINEWLFDGKFSMYMQSINFLLLCFAVLLGIVAYRYAKDSAWFFLYLSFMPALLMDRTYLIIITFLILINKKLLENIYLWTYVFVLLCIANVFYQPTYGGAVCASLLIPFVVMWRAEIIKSEQTIVRYFLRKRQLVFLISLILIGVCCIPLLHNAIVFLAENGKSTAEANGITILQSAKYFPVTTAIFGNKYLACLIVYLIRYALGPLVLMALFYYFVVYKEKVTDCVTRMQLLILSISGSVSYILMINATFNRIDSGLSRIGNVNCIYSCLLVIALLLLWRNLPSKMMPGILIGIMCFCGLYVNDFSLFTINEKVCTVVEIPEDAVFIKEEEHGLQNLGDVFTDNELYIYEAKILNEVCLKLLDENQTYYDCMDKSIYYNYTNKKVPSYHVAQYTLGGSTDLQEKAIKNMQKQDVPVIFIKGVESTSYISKRCYLMYRYLIQLDYRLIQYKGCYFLVDKEIDLTPIQTDIADMQWQWLTDNSEFANYIDKLRKKETSNKNNNLSNINGTDIAVIRFNNTEELAGVLDAELDGRMVSMVVNVGQQGALVLPTYLADKISVELSENLEECIQEVAFYNIAESKISEFDDKVQEIMEESELNKLNQALGANSVGYAAEEWGNNFDNMNEKFSLVSDLTKNIDETEAGAFIIEDISNVAGENAEFLYLQLENKQENVVATVITNGTDRNGNDFSESLDIALKYKDSALLIPIGCSPRVLTASEIESIEIHLSTSDVEVEKACLYEFK